MWRKKRSEKKARWKFVLLNAFIGRIVPTATIESGMGVA
jgi:hypothetical protein